MMGKLQRIQKILANLMILSMLFTYLRGRTAFAATTAPDHEGALQRDAAPE